MDEENGRRAVGGLGIVSGRASALPIKDASNCEDRGSNYCKRHSCNTRHKFIKGNQIVCSDRDRPSSSSFRPKSGKEVIGSSSKTYTTTTDARKPRGKFHDPSSHKETVSLGLNPEEERVVREPSASRVQLRVLEDENIESVVFNGGSMDTELGNYPAPPNARAEKQKCLGNHAAFQGSSTSSSYAHRSFGQASKVASARSQCSKATKYGLRNLRCTSISDVISSSSSSHSSHSRIKRGHDGECSTSAKQNMVSSSSSSSAVSSSKQMNSLSSPSLSLSERSLSRHSSRRTRYWPPSADGVTSVRTHRMTNGEAMSSISEYGHGNGLSPPEAPVLVPDLPQTELSIRERGLPSQQAGAESPNIHQNSSRRSFSRNEDLHIGPVLYLDDVAGGSFGRFSASQDGIQRFNVDGIAEVLLALERIQRDEELTYEQLLVLEANLFFGGLTIHDQHRDMRLDIDNMSYEELLALGEKMGTVSTALTDEELSKCLKRSCFRAAPPAAGSVGHGNDDDDVKCSICQEEYADGDEVGKLCCDHRYHVACVYQWLRLKNWCPICKADAAKS